MPPHNILGLIVLILGMAVHEWVLGVEQSVVVDESMKEETEANEAFLP